jgi:hypothetical protein
MAFSKGAKRNRNWNRNRNRHTTWSWLDLLIAAAIVLFGLYWLMLRGDTDPAARQVLIYRGDTVVATLPLAEDRRIDLTPHGVAMVVEIRDRRVRVLSSSCHQQLCVRKGWTAQVHDPIICIPNRVTIEVTGTESRYDAISR